MPFGYVHVFFGLLFTTVGWLTFLGKIGRRASPSRMKPIGILVMAIGDFLIVWAVLKGCFAAEVVPQVGDIVEADSAAVRAVEIRPHPDAPDGDKLVGAPILVEDSTHVQKILESLGSARMWTPCHPRSSWECVLALDYGDRKAYCSVYGTEDGRAYFDIFSGVTHGVAWATYRSDPLGGALEEAVRAAGESR